MATTQTPAQSRSQSGGTRFQSGQVILHRKFGYRGVIVSVDESFQGSDEWYEEVALSRPSKHRPWYHVLVDDTNYETYVAEGHLIADPSEEPVSHPLVPVFWDEFESGRYRQNRLMN